MLDTLPGLPAAPALPQRHPAEGMLGQARVGARRRRGRGATVRSRSVDGRHRPPGGRASTTDASRSRRSPRRPPSSTPSPPGTGRGRSSSSAPARSRSASPSWPPAPRPATPSPPRAPRCGAGPGPSSPKRRRRLPANPLVVVVDEPSLGAATLGEAPVGVEEAVDLVSGTLGTLEAVAVAGLHCCSYADWGAVLRAGPAPAVAARRDRRLAPAVRPRPVPRAGRLGGVGGGADERAAGAGQTAAACRGCGARSPPGGTPSPTAASTPCSCAAGPSSRRRAASPATTSRQAALALRLTAALGARVAAGTQRRQIPPHRRLTRHANPSLTRSEAAAHGVSRGRRGRRPAGEWRRRRRRGGRR